MSLHWEGITELEPLAREAGVSLATVRKHFPTKEALFGSCTAAFSETLVFPDLEALGAIAEPAQRLEACVSELCRIHEAMFGYAWTSAHRRNDSPTLDRAMRAYESLADAIPACTGWSGTPPVRPGSGDGDWSPGGVARRAR